MCFKYEETDTLKLRVWKKVYHEITNVKAAGVAMLISVQVILWSYECYFTVVKGSIHEKDIRILNVYVLIPSNRASEFVK